MTTLIACSTLLIVLGFATVIGASNYSQYTVATAQLEEGSREEQRAAIVEEKLQESERSADLPSANSKGLTLVLDRAHFIPLSPLSDSPGNQVKLLLDYSVQDPSILKGDTANAIMEVYAANQTLLRTSSFPEPITLDHSKGNIQLATTFDDPTLHDVTVRAILTDGQKIFPLSNPIETSISLGEVIQGAP